MRTWKILALSVVWYVVSCFTTVVSRIILSQEKLPLFLGQCQFLITGSIAFCILVLRQRRQAETGTSSKGGDNQRIFNGVALAMVAPLGIFQFVGKYFSLHSVPLISLATANSVRSMSPILVVIGYRLVFGVHFPVSTYLSLVPLIGGVIMLIRSTSSMGQATSANELDPAELRGVLYCLASSITFTGQNMYTKLLITNRFQPPKELALNINNTNSVDFSDIEKDHHLPKGHSGSTVQSPYNVTVESNRRFGNPLTYFTANSNSNVPIQSPDKMTTILYCSLIGFIISLVGVLANENPWHISAWTMFLIVVDSISHFIQMFLLIYLLESVPAVTYLISSIIKRIAVLSFSLLMSESHQFDSSQISSNQLWGVALVGIGLYSYSHWGSKAK